MEQSGRLNLAQATPNRLAISPWVFGVLIAGVALRLTGLTVSAFHYDEAFSLTMARQDLFEMVRNLTANISPPGWEMVVWFSTHLLGYNEFAARIIPFLANVAALWVAYLLTQELGLRPTHQIVAVAVLAFLPYQFWIAQEARTYAVYGFLYTLGILWAVRGRWLGLTAVMGLMLWCHSTAVFYGPTLALIAVVRHPRAWKSILVAGVVAVASWLIWLPIVFFQAGTIIPWFPPFTLAHVATNLEAAFFANALGGGWAIFGLLAVVSSSIVALWKTIGQTIDWFADKRRAGNGRSAPVLQGNFVESGDPRTNPNFILMLAVLVPLLLFLVYTLLTQNVFLFRPLSVTVPAWVMWLAPTIVFQTTPSRKLMFTRTILPALWTWTILAGLAGWSPQRTSSMRDVVNLIQTDWRSGDVIYYSSALVGNLFQYYLPDYHQVLIDRNGMVEEAISVVLKLNIPKAPLEDISYKRAWVVWLRDVNTSPRMKDYVRNCQIVGNMFFWQGSQVTEIYLCGKE